jgi:hypothetical protein
MESELAVSPTRSDQPRAESHNIKTLKMCVTAIRNIENSVPPAKVIFQMAYSFDLSLPAPWRAQHVDSYAEWDLRIKFFVNLASDTKSFYPPESLTYLRLEAAVWADVLDIREEHLFATASSSQPSTFQIWIDPACGYAAEVIQLGPLVKDSLFVNFAVKFENA